MFKNEIPKFSEILEKFNQINENYNSQLSEINPKVRESLGKFLIIMLRAWYKFFDEEVSPENELEIIKSELETFNLPKFWYNTFIKELNSVSNEIASKTYDSKDFTDEEIFSMLSSSWNENFLDSQLNFTSQELKSISDSIPR